METQLLTALFENESNLQTFLSVLDSQDCWKSVAWLLGLSVEYILEKANEKSTTPGRELWTQWMESTEEELLKVSFLLELISCVYEEKLSSFLKYVLREVYGSYAMICADNLGDIEFEQPAYEQLFTHALSLCWIGKEDKAMPYFKQSAELKYPPSLLRICSIVTLPHLRETTAKKVIALKNWFVKRAQTNQPIWQFHMGLYLEFVEGQKTEALKWYQLAADQGWPEAQYVMGEWYQEQNDTTQALEWFLKAAEEEHAGAQVVVGQIFLDMKKYQEAVHWFTEASKQGHPTAFIGIGVCHLCGVAGPRDSKQAREWFEKGAEEGSVECMVSAGQIYETERNVAKALDCYQMAVEKNYDKATSLLMSLLNEHGTEESVVAWCNKMAEDGQPQSQFVIGKYFYVSARDRQQGVEWVTKSATQGLLEAQHYLAQILDENPQTRSQAVYWYEKAAEQNHKESIMNLAVRYRFGITVKQDDAKSFYWVSKAAQRGELVAQLLLGYCYHYGDGVEQNFSQAMAWINRAFENGLSQAKIAHDHLPKMYQATREPKQEAE